jgi:hypothetical protein
MKTNTLPRMVYLVSALVVGAFFVAHPNVSRAEPLDVPTATPMPLSTANINIRAEIDGRSDLIVQGNSISWKHWEEAAPGRQLVYVDDGRPTYVNSVAWYPTWPDLHDAENRDCKCASSSYNPDPPIPPMSTFLRIEQVGYGCRGTCEVLQAPTVDNKFMLVVEFNDVPQNGPAWYEINIVTLPMIIGGIAEPPDIAAPSLKRAESSGGSPLPYAVAGAAGIAVLTAGAWYARRRWLH